MRQRIYIIYILLGFVTSSTLPGQEANTSHWDFRLHAGLNIGASAPIPTPKEVTKVFTWYPKLNPSLSLEATYWFPESEHWGVSLGVGCDYKGMEATTRVKDLRIRLAAADDVWMKGIFTGNNLTAIRNAYITVPIAASYRFGHFTARLGVYFGVMMESKFQTIIDGYFTPEDSDIDMDMDLVEMNFNDQIKPMDWGIYSQLSYGLTRKLSIEGGLSFGLSSIVKPGFDAIPFKLHNIYAQIGFGYSLN